MEDGKTLAWGTADGRAELYDLRMPSAPLAVCDTQTGHAVVSMSFQRKATGGVQAPGSAGSAASTSDKGSLPASAQVGGVIQTRETNMSLACCNSWDW